jgi:serine/threonine-protein kinase
VDEIILKSLRKEPTHRYGSVEQFSEDIRRHLEGLPVAARRGSLGYRGAKFLRRNRTRVIAAVVVAVILVAGLVATTWQGQLARAASRQTQAEARKVERANAFLIRMLRSVDPGAATGPHGSVRLMLDEAAASIEAGALAGQPDVEATVRTTLGMTYLRLGGLDEAGAHLQTALDIRRRVLGDVDALVAESLNNMGLLARATGALDAAETYYREALRQRRDVLGADSAEYAETLNNLGVLLRTAGRLVLAESYLRDALEIRRAVLQRRRRETAAGPQIVRAARADVATTTVNLAAALKNQGVFDQALVLYREATAHLRETLGPEHYRVAVCLNNQALLLADTGQYEAAEELYRESLAIRRKVFGDEHLAVATGLKNLALLLTTMGRYEEAEPLYRKALDLGRRLPGSALSLATTMNNLADLLASLQRCDEAQPLARAAMAIRRERDPDHPRLAASLLVLGRALAACDDAAAAQPLLRESLSLYGRRQPANDLKIARAQSELGGCLIDLDRWEEAEALLLESLALIRDGGVRHPVLARATVARLIDLYETWGRPDAAAPYLIMEDHL